MASKVASLIIFCIAMVSFAEEVAAKDRNFSETVHQGLLWLEPKLNQSFKYFQKNERWPEKKRLKLEPLPDDILNIEYYSDPMFVLHFKHSDKTLNGRTIIIDFDGYWDCSGGSMPDIYRPSVCRTED
ncbi:hypothetical protein [Pleionea sp. CnH1-48]|uniref:hypothetical protein n=1 Tax=Pleionea sp. CnH1-48 TaxID=2954494 RepID=UPI002096AD92|nr:hypothetical protein [Pleionea sp. CnH1-48]MCO7225651.1 hypothetical protein [Pleionea sp. CnH1-48]